MRYKELSWEIVGAAIEVHKALGPGLLESSYHKCLEAELRARGLAFATHVPISIDFRELHLRNVYEADLVVEGLIIVECKALSQFHPAHTAQLKTYMRWLGCDVGYLFNFHEATITGAGMKRIICSNYLKK